jgi:uncharacterized YccA/Bax inhibitor family protein
MKLLTTSPALAKGFSTVEVAPTEGVMTLQGAINKSALLLLILAVSAAGATQLSVSVLLAPVLIALVLSLVTTFRPNLAPKTSIPYAVCQGAVVGLISKIYAEQYGGGLIVFAVGVTVAIVAALLAVYRTGLIPVTKNYYLGVAAATFGVGLYYLAAIIFGAFGIQVPLVASTSNWGIGFSVLVVLIAAAKLVIDFDFIEKGAERGLPSYMEWFAAFGLLVTLVWLYLDILRLLAKLQSRRD